MTPRQQQLAMDGGVLFAALLTLLILYAENPFLLAVSVLVLNVGRVLWLLGRKLYRHHQARRIVSQWEKAR